METESSEKQYGDSDKKGEMRNDKYGNAGAQGPPLVCGGCWRTQRGRAACLLFPTLWPVRTFIWHQPPVECIVANSQQMDMPGWTSAITCTLNRPFFFTTSLL